jgi:hypothetical protein
MLPCDRGSEDVLGKDTNQVRQWISLKMVLDSKIKINSLLDRLIKDFWRLWATSQSPSPSLHITVFALHYSIGTTAFPKHGLQVSCQQLRMHVCGNMDQPSFVNSIRCAFYPSALFSAFRKQRHLVSLPTPLEERPIPSSWRLRLTSRPWYSLLHLLLRKAC